jgi:hypothetical protein
MQGSTTLLAEVPLGKDRHRTVGTEEVRYRSPGAAMLAEFASKPLLATVRARRLQRNVAGNGNWGGILGALWSSTSRIICRLAQHIRRHRGGYSLSSELWGLEILLKLCMEGIPYKLMLIRGCISFEVRCTASTQAHCVVPAAQAYGVVTLVAEAIIVLNGFPGFLERLVVLSMPFRTKNLLTHFRGPPPEVVQQADAQVHCLGCRSNFRALGWRFNRIAADRAMKRELEIPLGLTAHVAVDVGDDKTLLHGVSLLFPPLSKQYLS